MAIVGPTIRPLAPADIAAVVEFSLRAWAPVFESFRKVLGGRVYEALYPDWITSQARDVEAVCHDDTARVWVAEQQGRPVGFVALRIYGDGQTGEIYMLAVDPLVQRQGIGTALTSFAVQRLRDAGMGLAVVGTGGDPGHAPARRVYEKAGFIGLPLVKYYVRLDTGGGHKPVVGEGATGRPRSTALDGGPGRRSRRCPTGDSAPARLATTSAPTGRCRPRWSMLPAKAACQKFCT
jgi:ribosomal protein S18 acetylase RimI-like enzyme